MNIKEKVHSLSEKMNALSKQLDLSDELTETSSDIVSIVEDKTKDIELFKEAIPPVEVINLQILVNDFAYIRDTLKEATENGRRVLNILTIDLIESKDIEERAGLVTSFAEMNTTISNSMKIYIISYKEISKALLNIDQYQKQTKSDNANKPNINNTFNISTADLMKSLKGSDD